MYSLAKLVNTFSTLAQNINPLNQNYGIQFLSDQHRYTIQKYFDNERSFQTATIGSQSLTLTAYPNAGDTAATLSSIWPYASGSQLVNFTGTTVTVETTAPLSIGDTSATLTAPWSYTSAAASVTINTTFSNGMVIPVTYTIDSTDITWSEALTSAASTSITTVQVSDQRMCTFQSGSAEIYWTPALDSMSTNAIGTVGFQSYAIPAVISKISNDTVNVGQLKFVPIPIQTIDEWEKLNFLPYNSDIPGYFFIYNGQLKLFPVPSTTGNLITFNYKSRVGDFSTAFLFSDASGTAFVPGQTAFDYQKGTLTSLSVGSTTVIGSSTSWNTTGKFPLNTDVSFFNLYLIINPPYGDGIAYPISQFNDDTTLTLALPLVNVPSDTGTSYTIAQMPLLQEDFHDMLVYGALRTYFASIVSNGEKFKQFDGMYNTRLTLLEEYAGTKSVNVNLGSRYGMKNANRYIYSQIGIIPLE